MAEYRKDPIYMELESLINSAGVSVIYSSVHDDHIDGAIWARTDRDSMTILMPDSDEFPNTETACMILGHEMGHILSGKDSVDYPVERQISEATCDLIGAYLYRLAEMIAGDKLERSMRTAFDNSVTK